MILKCQTLIGRLIKTVYMLELIQVRNIQFQNGLQIILKKEILGYGKLEIAVG